MGINLKKKDAIKQSSRPRQRPTTLWMQSIDREAATPNRADPLLMQDSEVQQVWHIARPQLRDHQRESAQFQWSRTQERNLYHVAPRYHQELGKRPQPVRHP